MDVKYSNLVKKLLKECRNCGKELGDTTDFYSCSVKIDKTELNKLDATAHKGIIYIDAVCPSCGYIHSFSKDSLDKLTL